jgi:uncharacterized membrane protein YkoI
VRPKEEIMKDWNEPPAPEEPQGPPARKRNWVAAATLVASGLVAGGVLAATLSAGAQTETPNPSTTSTPKAGRAGGSSETALTGTTAEKVRQAALAAVPGGTIIRLETDSDGSPYEAHMTKADGTPVVVKVNDAFEVTSVEEERRGHGGRGMETELTGTTAERVRQAALEAVPGGTVLRVETDSDGSPYEAHVRKADGTEVVVKVNEAFEVTSVEEHTKGPEPTSTPS